MPSILFTVTNDLLTDQRMHRICGSLSDAGYDVTLVGVGFTFSPQLPSKPFTLQRIPIKYSSGKRFYLEYNRKLFAFIRSWLSKNDDKETAVCAIDLDTILPVWLATKGKERVKKVYDAHEYFTEMVEVLRRPWIRSVWLAIEKLTIPSFPLGYTVNETLANLFKQSYGHRYEVIRNLPVLHRKAGILPKNQILPEKFLLYQGAVNEGRAFELLIPAMKAIDLPLLVIGEGNYLKEAKQLSHQHNVAHKVIFWGKMEPEMLAAVTPRAILGFTLFSPQGHNQYHSLANRFFDYIMAGIPQVCVNYPEYKLINDKWQIAEMCSDLSVESIAVAVNKLAGDPVLHAALAQNCQKAKLELNWENESKKLIAFWSSVFK